MLELSVQGSFSAAHQLIGYEGDCRVVHGHNFTVEVTVKVLELNDIGIGIDFRDIKKELNFFLDQLDHRNLSELEQFKKVNPTSENIAIWLYKNLSQRFNSGNVKLEKVTVKESPKYSATYYGE